MSSGSIRIIQLTEKSSVNTDDYMAVDSSTNGTKKIKFTDLLDNNLSTQNKAADAQATGEAINDVNARVDNLIDCQNESVTNLWTGSLYTKNASVTLSDSISNYDFIDVYLSGYSMEYTRRPVSSTMNITMNCQNMIDTVSQAIHWYEIGITLSGTTATLTRTIACDWNNFANVPVVAESVGEAMVITRIDGIKKAQTSNSEIVDARVGADGVTYNSLGTAIRTQVSDLKSDINNLIAGQYEYKITWEEGDINSSGQEVDDNRYVRTGFIPRELIDDHAFERNGSYTLYVYYYFADKSFYSRTSYNADGTFNISDSVSYVRFAVAVANSGLLKIIGATINTEWMDSIETLESATAEIQQKVSVGDIKANYTEGYYIKTDGSIDVDANSCVSDKIDVTGLVAILFWYGTYNAYNRLVAFNANDEVVDYWGGLSGSEYRNITLTSAMKYVRFSFDKGYVGKLTTAIYSDGSYQTYWKAEKTDGLAKESDVEQLQSSVVGSSGLSNSATSLASGTTLSIDADIGLKKNKVYHLFANIDSNFDTLYFGHGEEEYSLYFKLDDTNITFMTNGTEGSALAHGLTLDTYVDIMLIVGEKNTGTLVINTLGGVYSHTVQVVNGYKGKVFVRPSNCTLTNVFIGFSSMDFRQPVWMFGDSYFTHTSDARWTYWLIEWGFGRCLLNAFAGENSEEAWSQALNIIGTCGIPKYLVWCMGMNDTDTGNVVNEDWKRTVEKLIEVCDIYGIIPILATIPNVPDYSNYYKNQYVKNSGYRYVDFAKAVGAESIGSSWYTGCLSQDNTHPTELGARLLCLQAIQDVPELTLGNI